jgi:hypothetical protein
MNNSIVIFNIAKYLCIDLKYLMYYMGKKDKYGMELLWYDIRDFTDRIKVKCNPTLLVGNEFRHKNGYAFSRALNSVRHLCDRQHFLESVLDLRYYISENYPIDLYNLPLASFN